MCLPGRGREERGGYCRPACWSCHTLRAQRQHKNAAGTKAITLFYSSTSGALCSYRRAHMHAFAVTTITQKLYWSKLCQRSTQACQRLIHQPGSHTRQPPAGHLHLRLRMASQSWDNERERRSVCMCLWCPVVSMPQGRFSQTHPSIQVLCPHKKSCVSELFVTFSI